MSAARDETTVPSARWMLGNSLWMLATAIPNSLLAWLGFLIIGVVGRMPRWIVTGVTLGVAALLAALPIWGQWQPLVRAIVYLGGMLLALVANPSWLRARWVQQQGTTRVAASGPVSAPEQARNGRRRNRRRSKPAEQVAARETPLRETGSRETASPATRLAEHVGASSAPYFAAAPAANPDPVDVNTADAGELAELAGLSRSRARKLVAQRDKQGGFASLDAFATAAGLQPHQLVRLRERATCSPPARGPRQFGRRVDY